MDNDVIISHSKLVLTGCLIDREKITEILSVQVQNRRSLDRG